MNQALAQALRTEQANMVSLGRRSRKSRKPSCCLCCLAVEGNFRFRVTSRQQAVQLFKQGIFKKLSACPQCLASHEENGQPLCF